MDQLEFDGVQFISARRAAHENGYTSDYIGQLIRGGKLEGRKVGRSWYVAVNSLAAYFADNTNENVSTPVAEETISPSESAHRVAVNVSAAKKSAKGPAIDVSTASQKKLDPEYALLTYLADDEPTMPALSAEASVSAVPVPDAEEVVEASTAPETPTEFYETLITEDIPKRSRGQRRELLPTPTALLAGLALALILTSGSLALITQRITYTEGKTTSTFALEYKGIDLTNAVASAIVGLTKIRLSE